MRFSWSARNFSPCSISTCKSLTVCSNYIIRSACCACKFSIRFFSACNRYVFICSCSKVSEFCILAANFSVEARFTSFNSILSGNFWTLSSKVRSLSFSNNRSRSVIKSGFKVPNRSSGSSPLSTCCSVADFSITRRMESRNCSPRYAARSYCLIMSAAFPSSAIWMASIGLYPSSAIVSR